MSQILKEKEFYISTQCKICGATIEFTHEQAIDKFDQYAKDEVLKLSCPNDSTILIKIIRMEKK